MLIYKRKKFLLIFGAAVMCCCVIYLSHAGKGQDEEDITNVTAQCHQPLVTLFTTLKPQLNKRVIYANTLRSWSNLRPYVVPILYTADDDDDNNVTMAFMEEEAKALGWTVFRAPEVWDGLPVLRAMFAHASQHSKTPFYGYANGDILFVDNLVLTLCYMHRTLNWTQFLLTSRRTNAKFDGNVALNTSQDIVHFAKDRGTLFYPNSEDLFVTGADSYPWASIPHFVVGRLGFDNWLVANAILSRIPVVDITETVLGLHQTDYEGNEAGRYSVNQSDLFRNVDLVDKDFYYLLGSVTCAPYATQFNQRGYPRLQRRQITDKNCLKVMSTNKGRGQTLDWSLTLFCGVYVIFHVFCSCFLNKT
jgi:hypothetical protein